MLFHLHIFGAVEISGTRHFVEFVWGIDQVLVHDVQGYFGSLFSQCGIDLGVAECRCTPDGQKNDFAAPAFAGKKIRKINKPLVIERAFFKVGLTVLKEDRYLTGALLGSHIFKCLQRALGGL